MTKLKAKTKAILKCDQTNGCKYVPTIYHHWHDHSAFCVPMKIFWMRNGLSGMQTMDCGIHSMRWCVHNTLNYELQNCLPAATLFDRNFWFDTICLFMYSIELYKHFTTQLSLSWAPERWFYAAKTFQPTKIFSALNWNSLAVCIGALA